MKNLLPLLGLVCIAFAFNIKTSDSFIDLHKNNKISIATTGNSNSTHYLVPLLSEITNTTETELRFTIPSGLHFSSVESGYQDVITTQSQEIVLNAGETKEVELNGLCIQRNNSSPTSKANYKLNGFGSDKFKTLADFLDDKDLQNSQAQQAMWVLSDDINPVRIIGLDDTHERELLNLTLKLADKEPMPDKHYKVYKKSAQDPTYRSAFKGSFTMKFSSGKQVQIAVFNDQGVLIKEVLNEWVEAGKRKVEYQLETTELRGQTITTQLIADNKVWSKRDIQLPG